MNAPCMPHSAKIPCPNSINAVRRGCENGGRKTGGEAIRFSIMRRIRKNDLRDLLFILNHAAAIFISGSAKCWCCQFSNGCRRLDLRKTMKSRLFIFIVSSEPI